MIEKTNLYVQIGKRINKIRFSKNISRSILAKKLNISDCEMQNIEAGRKKIEMNTLFRISEILETEMNYFITGIPNNRIIIVSDMMDRYIEVFKFVDSLNPKQRAMFNDIYSDKNKKSQKT